MSLKSSEQENAVRLGLSKGQQIPAKWGAQNYRHGGLMSTIEHVMYRHGSTSGFKMLVDSLKVPLQKSQKIKLTKL